MLSRLIGANVRKFCTKVRLDMVEENVVLETVTKQTFAINFLRAGRGPNGVILMPGAIGSIESDFQPQIHALPKLLENFTVVAWDPPGYSKSRPPYDRTFPVGFYHRDAYLADSLMRQLGFQQYSIVGWWYNWPHYGLTLSGGGEKISDLGLWSDYTSDGCENLSK